MQQHSIPVCYFPTTAYFIDDNRDFLLNFVLQLDEHLAYRMFDSPFSALESLRQKQCEVDVLNRRCLTEYTEAKNCPHRNHTINLDLAPIHAEIYNPNRFSEVSVVIVDYAMPGMNGLEFCRNITDTNIKKILLTGQADEKLAIEAFNEGLIDRFIHKSDRQAGQLITKAIYDLQWQYFQEMSDIIVRMLSVSSPSCLQDKVFAGFFLQLCDEHNIKEYYLADNSGSFMLVNEDAEISYLIIANEQDKHQYTELARDAGVSKSVLTKLSEGTHIPCFWQLPAQASKAEFWQKQVVSAAVLKGAENYRYALIQENDLFEVQDDKIYSYHRHLEDLDAEELLML